MAGLQDLIEDAGSVPPPKLEGAVGISTNKELMDAARLALSGNWGMAVLGYILYFILLGSFSFFLLSSILFVGFVGGVSGADPSLSISAIQAFVDLFELLVSGAIIVGFCSFFLTIAQERDARLEKLFTGFKRFWKSFGAYFFYSLFVLLWMLLLIIPGIIATFRYAMVFYIVADDEGCGPLQALGRSKELMNGNKWKFFCLQWRFFGWAILCSLTFGIGYLWLIPYMQTTNAKFYEDVK